MIHIAEVLDELNDRGDLPERIQVSLGKDFRPFSIYHGIVLEWDDELKAYTKEGLGRCVPVWFVRKNWGKYFASPRAGVTMEAIK